MKAMVVGKFGGPEVLTLEEVATPKAAPGEVVIRVRGVSLNPAYDLKIISGGMGPRRIGDEFLPMVPGVDAAGEVTEIGEGLSDFSVGDRVAAFSRLKPLNSSGGTQNWSLGLHRWGGFAEFMAAPAENLIAIQDEMSYAEASVILRHAPTAMFMLEKRGALQAGEWVLVMGASGGLGSIGLQVAKQMGARVIAGAGADDRVKGALELGADHGINYRSQDLTGEVMRITDGHGVDVVFENVSDPETWPQALSSMAFDGRMVTAGVQGGGHVTLDIERLYIRRLRIIGGSGSTLELAKRALAFPAGTFKVLIDRTLPLAELQTGYKLWAERKLTGKIIIDPSL